ncbi:hypothetical protein FA15DRAFT_666374 [Coprinopsis marcescibilis]|uniref:Uncharacterized protein n=1 Tax=Coprinopsis marcescibilis TaxID=230819 RepID=A0A5C3LFN4_COPMA|nr:hypothetical protein FA15DRAFT_666374 [Coprinopsis marcescibilis]
MQFLNTLGLLMLAIPLNVLAGLHIPRNSRHVEIAKRAEGHISLHRRFDNSKWTWYEPESMGGM